jgi:predicted dehydrogenase
VDAAVIALPVSEHAEHVSWALAQGWHVFVEKSPAVDPSQLRKLIDQATDSGLVCCVGMNFRYAEGVHALLHRLATGRHGKVSYVRVVQVARKPIAPLGPGLSFEASLFHAQGIHTIDLALQFAPTATQISGHLLPLLRGALCGVVGQDPNTGTRVEVSFGSCAAGLYHQLDLICDSGDLLSLRNLSELHFLPNGGGHDVDDYPGARVVWRRSPVSVGYGPAGYAAELAAFRNATLGQADDRLATLGQLQPVYDAFDQLLTARGLKWTA